MTYRKEEHPQYSNIVKYETLEGWPEIKGYDFDQPFNFDEFLKAYASTGIQAANLGQAIKITNNMIDDKATIFLSCTSNMGSSGIRDIIAYLLKHKCVHALVMSAGGVEEDVIKTLRPFVAGSFDASGSGLANRGVGRIGNIFAPYERYLHFEKFIDPFLERVYQEQQETKHVHTPSEFLKKLGLELTDERSFLYWAAKNDIPVFCPALTDGAIGDLLIFARQRHKDFMIDLVGDSEKIYRFALEQEKTGAIFLGGGVSKHYTMNANIFRDGLDYAVYVTTASEFDASDSGGNPQEAMSWFKLKADAPHVKLVCDASIAFPLIVAGSFARKVQE